jgi:hypothetical protein
MDRDDGSSGNCLGRKPPEAYAPKNFLMLIIPIKAVPKHFPQWFIE